MAAVRLFAVALVAASGGEAGAEEKRISDISLAPPATVRLLTEPILVDPNLLLLQSSDSPAGPWWNEPEFQRNPSNGRYEFLTPRKPHQPQRFYRLTDFKLTSPVIRFISPVAGLRPGHAFSLLGENFAPTTAGNTVQFETANGSWTAPLTESASNYIMGTIKPRSRSGCGGSGSGAALLELRAF